MTHSQLEDMPKSHLRHRLDQSNLPQGLKMLILKLLEGEEMGWPQLLAEVLRISHEEHLQPGYCLRLEEEQPKQKEAQGVQMTPQPNRTERLRALSQAQLNLVPSRIQLLSKKEREQ